MKNKQLSYRLLILFVCMGCQTYVTEDVLKQYITDEKNNVYQTTQSNGIDFTVYIRPADLFVLQEVRGKQETLDMDMLGSVQARYDSNLYISLEIARDGKGILQQTGSSENYSRMLRKLSFGMDQYVYAVTGKGDTIQCKNHRLGQFYGMELATKMIFVFSRKKIMEARKFDVVIDDFGLNTNTVTLTFKARDIKKIPKLKFIDKT